VPPNNQNHLVFHLAIDFLMNEFRPLSFAFPLADYSPLNSNSYYEIHMLPKISNVRHPVDKNQ
jgi:hypothetical protein